MEHTSSNRHSLNVYPARLVTIALPLLWTTRQIALQVSTAMVQEYPMVLLSKIVPRRISATCCASRQSMSASSVSVVLGAQQQVYSTLRANAMEVTSVRLDLLQQPQAALFKKTLVNAPDSLSVTRTRLLAQESVQVLHACQVLTKMQNKRS